MTPSQLLRKRRNTVNPALTGTPAGWLTRQYRKACRDQAYPDIGPMLELKSTFNAAEPMRVTAADYGDTGRWWL